METLRSLVGDPAPFLATAWGRQACLLRPPAPLAPPVTLADVDAVLASGLLRIPYLELVSQGKALEQGDYTSAHHLIDRSFRGYADTAKVMGHLDSGATLLMRNIEHWHSGAAALVGRLGAELSRGVEAFLFVTPPGRKGFDSHRDDADVFVLQLHGSKRWQVHAVPEDGRWQSGPEPEPGPVQLETTVHAGEVLYVPRGAPHSAVGHTDGLSFHLSLTVRQPGTADLRTALTRRFDEGLELPPLPVDPVELRRTAAALLDHYRERLAGLTPEALCAAAETVSASKAGTASTGPHRTLANLAAALGG
ncbi:cupin [Kitasatospora sp. RG8]|uniref:JmjC domain-containing protein n=1 Tax=Kitasatospora sp. RG8 TaxID=2820815 RepID=UPI001ADF72FB|nr:cupin domain-containing protein [Kitasatospora sp. RG8]MBP0448685.1 cupin [Kitasatospora sp. RG8]